MKSLFNKKLLSLIALLLGTALQAIPVTNFERPYDVDFRLKKFGNHSYIVGACAEMGQSKTGYNHDAVAAPLLTTYANKYSTIASFKGAASGSTIANYLSSTLNNASDSDGVRGFVKPDAKFSQADMTLWGKYRLPLDEVPGTFYVGAYLPLRSAAISEVSWGDQTAYVTSDDTTVHQQLTDKLKSVMQQYGSLSIDSWSRTSLGDAVVMLGWYKDFKQTKDALKNVTIQTRLGVSCPTGLKKDEDIALSMSTGNDGAWGIPVSLGIDLDFLYDLSAGIDVTYLGLFNQTRDRRLKTDKSQSDYLLLTKGRAIKVHASTWNFNLYLKASSIFKGLNLMAEYEFAKHDEDQLYPEGDNFSFSIVNSAQSLQEWSYHNVLLRGGFDFCHMMSNKSYAPRFDLYAKIPVMGRRVISAVTYGLELSMSF